MYIYRCSHEIFYKIHVILHEIETSILVFHKEISVNTLPKHFPNSHSYSIYKTLPSNIFENQQQIKDIYKTKQMQTYVCHRYFIKQIYTFNNRFCKGHEMISKTCSTLSFY